MLDREATEARPKEEESRAMGAFTEFISGAGRVEGTGEVRDEAGEVEGMGTGAAEAGVGVEAEAEEAVFEEDEEEGDDDGMDDPDEAGVGAPGSTRAVWLSDNDHHPSNETSLKSAIAVYVKRRTLIEIITMPPPTRIRWHGVHRATDPAFGFVHDEGGGGGLGVVPRLSVCYVLHMVDGVQDLEGEEEFLTEEVGECDGVDRVFVKRHDLKWVD
ncbi:hypothetical protein QJS10_CPA08g01259 [Acorus calamus]|uniref:Uncharacterized protein n=1 Tax=Acorus calamus TaxID=4465 RepID=A0AAV9E8T4_ACOCL|nr:hypothetical protein QJS10_CPA08g01259 [Acorus calamus]